jgi:hypothetical protein
VRCECHEDQQVPCGVGTLTERFQHTGEMPVGLGVIRFLTDHTLKRRPREFQFAEFLKHASEAGAGFEVIMVEFHRHVVPLASCSEITDAVEQFGQEKRQLGCWRAGLQDRPDRVRGLHKVTATFKVRREAQQFVNRLPAVIMPLQLVEGSLGASCKTADHSIAIQWVATDVLKLAGDRLSSSKCERQLATGTDIVTLTTEINLAILNEKRLITTSYLPGIARKTGELPVDLLERKTSSEQSCEPATNHQLGIVEPLQTAGAMNRLKKPSSSPVPDRGDWNTDHLGHHRSGIAAADRIDFHGCIRGSQAWCCQRRTKTQSLRGTPITPHGMYRMAVGPDSTGTCCMPAAA